jgi:hypothetical protein
MRWLLVVNIAQRDPGLPGDVSQRRVPETMSIGGVLGGMKEPYPDVCFRF